MGRKSWAKVKKECNKLSATDRRGNIIELSVRFHRDFGTDGRQVAFLSPSQGTDQLLSRLRSNPRFDEHKVVGFPVWVNIRVYKGPGSATASALPRS